MKTKHASRLPIQQMIANVISSATEKVAADQGVRDQKVKNLLAYEKKEHGHIPTPSEEEDEKVKMASAGSDFIEKLASAVEYIAGNFDSINFPNQGVLQKKASEMSPQGAGKGPGSLEVTHSTRGGTQSYETGHAHNIEASTSKAHASLSGAREGDGKTQLENDMHHAPGGGGIAPTAKYPPKGPLVAGPSTGGSSKTASASAIRAAVLRKLAGEDVMKANIEAERTANPLAGMGQLESFDTSQPAPHQSGDASGSGNGNGARRLISSNESAINATKRDAKGPVKSQLSEVLEEPALSSSTDPVLNNNLQNTGKAGVKIAAARTALEKVAQRGCTCETIERDCAFCRLGEKVAAATQSRGSSKTANAMMGYGGGSGMSGSMSPTMSGGGGGMMSMADAGAGADGCTCGETGECRVCKLKAALAAAAKAGGTGPSMSGPEGPPIESGSPGAAPVGTY